MPAPLAVDREAVRVLVVAVGVREAAARMKLPVGTVAAWSARGSWLAGMAAIASLQSGAITTAKAAIAEQLPASMRSTVPRGHADGAITPAEALQSVLDDDSRASRLAGSRATRAALEYAAGLPGADAHAAAQDTLTSLKGAALVHAWEDKSQASLRVNIYASIQSAQEQERPVIDV